MAILDDIGAYIDTNNATLTLGTNLFLSLLPETPDNCVSLYEDSGAAGMYTHGSTGLPVLERPGLQFIVRNTVYASGRSLSEDIYRLLAAVVNQSIGSNTYLRIEAIHSPSLMERDSSSRCLFTCSFDIIKVTL